MGFGYLVLGYLFTINFVYSSLTLFPATLLMLAGMQRLGRFHPALREARFWLICLSAVSAGSFFLELLRFFSLIGEGPFRGTADVLATATACLMLLFHERLLLGIEALAEETDLPKLRYRAKRNRVFSLLVFSLTAALSLPLTEEWYLVVNGAAWLPVLLCRVVTAVLNALLLYSCYMWICLPEDLDMSRKKSGIAWLDRIREKMDRREEEADAKKKAELEKLYRSREAAYREKQNKKRRKP